MKFFSQFAGLVVRPEMSYTPNGVCMVKWTMPYDVYDPRSKSTNTQWLQCVAFGERFEKLVNDGYLTAGRTVQANGSIKCNAFMRRDNTAAASIEMTVNDISFVQISKGNADAQPKAKTPAGEVESTVEYYNPETGGF